MLRRFKVKSELEKMIKEQRKSNRQRLELEALQKKVQQQVNPDRKVLAMIEDELAKLKA